ncbi:MAG: translocation/assembly module TamB domain-containing protein [Hyphomicrobiales bacterium]
MRKLAVLFFVFCSVLLTFLPAFGQEEQEKSSFIEFVEGQLSSPNRQIRLNGLEGTLSSNVTFDSITIADENGVWLEIESPQLIWNRTALFRGRLEVEELTAKRIDYRRQPIADESLPNAESSALGLPDLPVAIVLKSLSVPAVAFGPTVFGLETTASVDGSVLLDEGSLDLDLNIQRLDGSGGTLVAKVGYAAGDRLLSLNIGLDEPENGIVATLLGIEQRPPVSLRIQGDAPIEDLLVSLVFDVDAQRILDGQLAVQGTSEGLSAKANLGGPLSKILNAESRQFFGPRSNLAFGALFPSLGGVVVDTLEVDSGNVQLNANAATLADGFLSALNVDLRLKPTGSARVIVPTEQGDVSVSGANVVVNYDAAKSENWNAELAVTGFQGSKINLNSASLGANGKVLNFQEPAMRSVSFDLAGRTEGISSSDIALANAIGNSLSLKGSGRWNANAVFQLSEFLFKGDAFSVGMDGFIANAEFDGNIELEAKNLAPFSILANRNLGGGAGIMAQGKIGFFNGEFDLTVEGAAQALSIDDSVIDRLLVGTTTFFGGVARSTDGLAFRDLNLSNEQLDLKLNGRFASEFSDLRGEALIRDLAVLNENGSGAVTAKLNLTGNEQPFDLKASLNLPQGRLVQKTARDLSLLFVGKTDSHSVTGSLSADGFLGPERIGLSGEIHADQNQQAIKGFFADIGATDIRGEFSRGANGLIDADATIDSSDISSLSALGLIEGSGSLQGIVRLQPTQEGGQSGEVQLNAKNIVFADTRVAEANVDATLSDLFKKPRVNAKVSGRSVVVGGFDIQTFDGNATTVGQTTDFELAAAFSENDARLATSGVLTQDGTTSEVLLNSLTLISNIATARLDQPARVRIEDGVTQISDAILRVGNGSVVVNGSAGDTIDVNVILSALPLNIANAIRPDLELAGVISGELAISGSTNDPSAQFELVGTGLSASALRQANLSPLQLTANGSFKDQVVAIAGAALQNSQGINLTARGHIPTSAGNLNIDVDGTAPLSLANLLLQERGARATGTAQINVSVGGTPQKPIANGPVTISGGTFSDPISNASLNNISVDADLSASELVLNQFRANLAAGGGVSATGRIGLTGVLPANLTINVDQAKYSDAQTFSTVLNGNLALTGSLLQSPLLSGDILLGNTEITLPESFAGSANLLDVRHVLPARATRETLNRLARASPVPTPTSRPSVLRLDLVVNAPNRIFVRGRGLDAELGGRVRLSGPVVDIEPIGSFELIRGRLSVVGKRIDLDEGLITLEGDLNPIIEFVARIEADDIDAFINISGRLDDLSVTLSSSPELPEDEVLSQIIFGRGIEELSPLQIAKLASVALELTGGNSPSLIENLRRGTGLDDLDLVDDGSGNAAVRAGKYINDNVYLNLQAGKTTEATINLDITDSLRAKGSVSSEGNTSIGVFFEKDY